MKHLHLTVLLLTLVLITSLATAQTEEWYVRYRSSAAGGATSTYFCKGDNTEDEFITGTIMASLSGHTGGFLKVQNDGSIVHSHEFGLSSAPAELLKLNSVKTIPDGSGNDLGYVGVGRIISDDYQSPCQGLTYISGTTYKNWIGFITVTGGSITEVGNQFVTSKFDDEVFYFSLGTDQSGNDYIAHTQPTDVIVDRNGDIVVTGFVVMPSCQNACEDLECTDNPSETYRPFLAKYSVDFNAASGLNLSLIRSELLEIEINGSGNIKGFIPTCIIEDPAPTSQPYYIVGGRVFGNSANGQIGFPALFQVSKLNATNVEIIRLKKLSEETGVVNDMEIYNNGTESRLISVGDLDNPNTGFIATNKTSSLLHRGFVEITDASLGTQSLGLISILKTCNDGVFAIEGNTNEYPFSTKIKIFDDPSGTYIQTNGLYIAPCYMDQIGARLTKKRIVSYHESSSAFFNNNESYLMLFPTQNTHTIGGKLSLQYVAVTDDEMKTDCSNVPEMVYQELTVDQQDWIKTEFALNQYSFVRNQDQFINTPTSTPLDDLVCAPGESFAPNEASSTELDFATHSNINIYPNPNTGEFRMEASEVVSKIDVYSIQGKLVKTLNIGAEAANIDLTDIPQGTYILQIEVNGTLTQSKITKQ